MGVEIVLHHNDLWGLGKVDVSHILERMGIIDGGMSIRDLDVPPAFKRREHHKKIGRAVAFIFVIETRRLPFLHRDRRACFGNQLLGRLVQTDQRAVRIPGPFVHSQHVFHGRDKGAVGCRRDDPLLLEVGLERVFFKVRPIVLSLA